MIIRDIMSWQEWWGRRSEHRESKRVFVEQKGFTRKSYQHSLRPDACIDQAAVLSFIQWATHPSGCCMTRVCTRVCIPRFPLVSLAVGKPAGPTSSYKVVSFLVPAQGAVQADQVNDHRCMSPRDPNQRSAALSEPTVKRH